MYFYRKEDGSVVSFFRPLDGLDEITKEEFESEIKRIESEQKYEPEPTPEERLSSVEQRTDALESNSAEIQEALDMLLSGVTE